MELTELNQSYGSVNRFLPYEPNRNEPKPIFWTEMYFFYPFVNLIVFFYPFFLSKMQNIFLFTFF